MIKQTLKKTLLFIALGTLSASSLATVSPTDAARLGQDLTPLGAEKAGNADGTIPAWDGGGIGEIPEGYVTGGHHPDPFADEQPLFIISSDNVDEYADKLSAGQLAMFKTYPDSFKMKVYPSHRTFQVPEWVYDRTRNCAESASLTNTGNGVTGAHACYPFPIPKTGVEVMWNHELRYQGIYRVDAIDSAAPDAHGRYVLDKVTRNTYWPYWDLEKEGGDQLSMFIPRQLAPARVAGDTFLLLDYLDASANPRQAWRYFGGQRRVRRAPVFAFDTPIPPAQGLRTVDTYDMYFGSPEKYNWELKGKKEMFVGYNAYGLGAAGVQNDELIQKGHINPEYPRYELHRVWAVEATLKEGERHIYPKREIYVDEDSWQILVHDMYDDKGQLWRTAHRYAKLYWEVPLMAESNEVHHDLISRRYNVVTMMGENKGPYDFSQAPPGESFFTPANVRKMGVR
ncbi:MAG: DUF1329 domain-containing protein [Halioglobus sp.]